MVKLRCRFALFIVCLFFLYHGFRTGRLSVVSTELFGIRIPIISTEKTDYETWKSVKVLCFVETHPANLERQTKFVKMTWGPKCDVTLYISDKFNETFPTIAVTNYTGHEHLWAKTRSTIQMLYDQYMDSAHWFLKTDDDTFVMVDNLKRFLAKRDSNTDIRYYGKFFNTSGQGGFNSGGAGYVFGRETLRRLVERGFKNNSQKCPPVNDTRGEDVLISLCMHHVGVECSREVVDNQGRELFHAFDLQTEFRHPWVPIPWGVEYSLHQLGGHFGLSKDTISYHYVNGPNMLLLEYLFHNFTRPSTNAL